MTIAGFTLVDELALDLSPGMTVVTGETGAGKSIMLDALALTLGDRADANLVSGDKCEILSEFDASDIQEALAWLAERELGQDDNRVILRRTISREGRSRAFINGVPSTLQDARELGNLLIDIHSQHEHQSLLKRETHRRLLDEYAGIQATSDQLASVYRELHSSQESLQALIDNNRDNTDRVQLLTYQMGELLDLGLLDGEVEELVAEQKRLASAEITLADCAALLSVSEGDDNEGSLADMERLVNKLTAADNDQLKPTLDLFRDGLIQLQEASRDLQHFCDGFEADPVRLQTVEERLDQVYTIARKHHVDTHQLTEVQTIIAAELDSLENHDQHIAELEQKIEQLASEYDKIAAKVSKARQQAGVKLSKAIGSHLSKLGMENATLEVSLASLGTGNRSVNGVESVELLISTNPGQAPRPLNKIASGGELSRISLAIQVATAETSTIPTLVFDEVDVGIGGATAEVVGQLLRKLGESAQIICVTHLPQVAAQGHQHWRVEKTTDAKKAHTSVIELNADSKITEIARMLGGVDLTDQTLAHASEMFSAAQAR